jgi:hypothetical protein
VISETKFFAIKFSGNPRRRRLSRTCANAQRSRGTRRIAGARKKYVALDYDTQSIGQQLRTQKAQRKKERPGEPGL